MKFKGENPNIVMVDRDTYEAMVEAFNRVKAERFRNKQIADKLEDDLELLNHDLEALSNDLTEFSIVLSNLLDEVNKHVQEENLKNSLKEKIDSVSYGVIEMSDKLHRLFNRIKNMKTVMKPFEDYHGG